MGLIPEHVLDEIQSRADIAEVIGRYVPLKRAGRHFKALCPFHKERTPSFHVNTDKQIFHCFGCGVGGNIFSFLVQHDRLTFPDAVRQVAQQVGVVIPEEASGSRDAQTQKLFEILDKACRYYERQLAHPARGRAARAYLQSRGVVEATRQAFRLGYAPEGPDQLIQAAKRATISAALLEQTGFVVQGRGGPIDRFRERLMFPILDVRGRVVSFGGRSLADQEPKYLNGPQTAVYSKSRQLFGLPQAKEAIVKEKVAVVVEGYFDAVWLWQAGIRHVVSPLGTAFTPEQAKLLSRYAPRVILAFDADAAGAAATLRGIEVLLEAGLEVHVAQLPTGLDPDEFVRRRGSEAMRDLLAKALSVVECLIAQASASYGLREPEGKVRAVQSILPVLAKVSNAMLRTEYARIVAERFALDERAVLQELAKAAVRRPSRPSGREPIRVIERTPTLRAQGAERVLTALIVDEPSRWDAISGQFSLETVTDPSLRRVVATICELRAAGHADPTPAQLISRLAERQDAGLGDAPEAPDELVSGLVQLADSISARDTAWRQSLARISADAKKRRLAQLREQLRVEQQAGHGDDVQQLLVAYQAAVKGE